MDEYSANIYLFTNSHTTIGRRFDISVYNNLAYAIGNDTTRPRILDGSNVTNNFGIHLTVLESEIGIGRHDATAELEIVGIAERLCLDDLAVYECQSIGIPSEIFTIEDGIDDRDIVRIPESVLSVEHRISYLHILAILERIVAIEAEIGNFDILAMHEKIVALIDLDILELDILAVPESLGSVEELDAWRVTPSISRNILGASTMVSDMTRLREYHRAARPPSVKWQLEMVKPSVHQKGYLPSKRQLTASILRVSLRELSPVWMVTFSRRRFCER